MTLINFIVILLLIIPIIGVISDLKEGKIKNYFIFPSLIFVIILSFFIQGFYTSKNNIIGLIIILFFSYLFYKDNKWGAGDGKYLILIGFCTIIIGYLKGTPALVIKLLIFTFSIFLIYVVLYLILNYKEIRKIKFIKEKIKIFDLFFLISILKICIFFIIKYLPQNYSYIIIFIIITIILPLFQNYKNIYFKIFIIGFCLILTVINSSYLNLIIVSLIFIIFNYISIITNQIFDLIDIKEIKIIDLKQGDILTNKTIEKIKKEANIELSISPIQGLETYNILKYYKDINKEQDLIMIYKDIRIGIFLYLGFLLTIIYSIS